MIKRFKKYISRINLANFLFAIILVCSLIQSGFLQGGGFYKEDHKEATQLNSKRFYARGTSKPEIALLPHPVSPFPPQLKKVAIEVYFDLIPTMMRFSLPCFPCVVTENNIHFSNGWTETYDPKASGSCEPLWDKEARYVRMWIASQNPARIVVRVRYALCDQEGRIAHLDFPSGSPYGLGDWTDEWYYIYPDGIYTRHVRIYSGLAEQSLTMTDETFKGIQPVREIPPNVVHEFQEDFIFGLDGHIPENDIDQAPITLIMMDGRNKTISYKPYPKDFGEFSKANIKLINLKSEYKPFTIFIPYGVENVPYPPEGELPHVFQTWPRHPKNGYSVSLGHTLNWWHYRRTEKLLEQVYLSGMITAEEPMEKLIFLAHSWLRPPRLKADGIRPEYNKKIFDTVQRAYILSCGENGPKEFEIKLAEAAKGDRKVYVFNPVFLIKNWGSGDVEIFYNNNKLFRGSDYRIGYEKNRGTSNLVVWINRRSEKAVYIKITPI